MARPKKNPETKPAPAVVEAVKEAKETVAAKVAAKKAPAQKNVEDIYLQFGGSEWNISDCKERVLAAYAAAGHTAAGVKKLEIYIKPEEGKAYYVINDAENGSIDL